MNPAPGSKPCCWAGRCAWVVVVVVLVVLVVSGLRIQHTETHVPS